MPLSQPVPRVSNFVDPVPPDETLHWATDHSAVLALTLCELLPDTNLPDRVAVTDCPSCVTCQDCLELMHS